MTRVARERRVVTKEPEPFDAWGRGSDALDVKTIYARNDDHTADRRAASEARETSRTCWKHKEPVPRKEGRLH